MNCSLLGVGERFSGCLGRGTSESFGLRGHSTRQFLDKRAQNANIVLRFRQPALGGGSVPLLSYCIVLRNDGRPLRNVVDKANWF